VLTTFRSRGVRRLPPRQNSPASRRSRTR